MPGARTPAGTTRLLDHPIDAVRLGPVRYFPAVQQALQYRLRDRRLPLSVLAEQALLRGLDVDDADAGVVVGRQLDALPPQLPAQVGRAPHERPAAAEVF